LPEALIGAGILVSNENARGWNDQPRAVGRVIEASEVQRPSGSMIPTSFVHASRTVARAAVTQARICQDGNRMNCIAGIDVSKDHLDVAFDPDGPVRRFASDPPGRHQLVQALKEMRVDRVVLEATGGYERSIVIDVAAAGFEVVRVNPRQVRNFARATGCLAKSDPIDAKIICHFGHALKPPAREAPDSELIAIRELLARRGQVIEMQSGEKTRRQQVLDSDVRSSIERTLSFLKDELARLDQELDERVSQRADWSDRARVLQEESGVGPIVARSLLIDLPELGRVTRQQIAALAGVAPMNCDTGKKKGVRKICGGRSSVRRMLYMAALVASRHHPKIRAHYLHLQAMGKCKKVALVACMRKLLVILNAKLRDFFETQVSSPAGSIAAASS